MAVRQMNTIRGYAPPRQEGIFPAAGRQQASSCASLQVQDWTRGLDAGSRNRNSVITETIHALPVLSSSGIRWDVLLITLILLLSLFFGILFTDLEALSAGGRRIGQLSAGIVSLENSNAQLQAQLEITLRNSAYGRTITDQPITLPGGTVTASLP